MSFPDNAYLESKWWHRLAKSLFFASSLLVFLISVSVFYSLERSNAIQYQVIQSFSNFLQKAKVNRNRDISTCAANNDQTSGTFDPYCFAATGPIDAPESFVQENDLAGYSLGCQQPDGTVSRLSADLFESWTNCDKSTGLSCTISSNICDGDASKVIKYDTQVRYQFINYVYISLKSITVAGAWAVLAYLLYYKMLIYIIYGSKKIQL